MSRKVINRELDRLEKIESRNLDIDTYIVQNLRKFVDTLQDLPNSTEIEQRLIKYAKESKLAGCSADENRLYVWGEEELWIE
jgi:hypothetical protein